MTVVLNSEWKRLILFTMLLMMPTSLLSAETMTVTSSKDEHLRFFVDQFCQNEDTTLGELLERLLRCRESQAVSN